MFKLVLVMLFNLKDTWVWECFRIWYT